MARRHRIELAGCVYHVTNRGMDRRDIVCDDDDRREWFRLFNRVALRCQWRVAYAPRPSSEPSLKLQSLSANSEKA